VAGKQAITESAISRAVLPFPVLMFPTVVMAGMQTAGLFKKITIRSRLVELGLVAVSLTFALPLAVSVFK